MAHGNAMLFASIICPQTEAVHFFFVTRQMGYKFWWLTTRQGWQETFASSMNTSMAPLGQAPLPACIFSYNAFSLALEIFLQESGGHSDLPTLFGLFEDSCPRTMSCEEQCVHVNQTQCPA